MGVLPTTGKARSMKVMKAKRVSNIARGRFAKALVLRGSKAKTASGLTADMLMKNKRGKIVSKRKSASGALRYAQVESWVEAHMKARQALKIEGFVPINGRSVQGKAIYVKAKAIAAAATNAPFLVAALPVV